METAELELKKGPSQSGAWPSQSKTVMRPADTVNSGEKRAVEKGLRRRINELDRCTRAGQEDIRCRIDKLHTLLKNIRKDDAGGGQGSHGDHLEEHAHKPGVVYRVRTDRDGPLQHHPDTLAAGQVEADQENGNGWDKENTVKGRAGGSKGSKESKRPSKGKFEKNYR